MTNQNLRPPLSVRCASRRFSPHLGDLDGSGKGSLEGPAGKLGVVIKDILCYILYHIHIYIFPMYIHIMYMCIKNIYIDIDILQALPPPHHRVGTPPVIMAVVVEGGSCVNW